jgi:hypothetical protein
VESPEQKRTLHDRTGAEFVDMETFAVADVCRSRAIPFFAFRVILDTVDERIPQDVTKILEGMGKGVFRFSGTVLGGLFSRPSMVFDIAALKKRAFIASERLAQFAVAELCCRKIIAGNNEPLLLKE